MPKTQEIKVVKSLKTFGGAIKQVRHWSECNQCYMNFQIFVPEDDVPRQRGEAFSVIYMLAGLTCDYTNAVDKSGYGMAAGHHKVAIVFPDTSPRDVELPEKIDNYRVGFGAGHYCNATADGWSKHFNMYTYITKELPAIVEKFFHVSPTNKSIMGSSMGGNGALNIAARNPGMFKSVSAFSPIGNSSKPESGFCALPMKTYFANKPDEAKLYDCSESILAAKEMPPGLVDQGTHDDFLSDLGCNELQAAIGKSGHKIKYRW